ncbi:uncharacterized protein LOC133890947 isoform X2 [Phragmites australis]|uniref:uncharacterized protein LOC133890947 isoform X2 n=1 Tax=Phragmites australis TaxID=29695 RepID=UPI002D78FA94|nr:uncharacterized protein LOC133890947 isoform X2 [Phragmites australis]
MQLWLALESFGHATAWLSHHPLASPDYAVFMSEKNNQFTFMSRKLNNFIEKDWNIFSVNVAMAGTGLYQLSRKIRQDYFSDENDAAASLEG